MRKLVFCVFFIVCWDYVELIKIEENLVKKWASDFKSELNSHLEKELSYTKVQDMLRNYERYLTDIPINGKKTFEDIYTNVNLKYNDLVLAVNKLKSEIEKSLKTNQASDDPDDEASFNINKLSNLKPADDLFVDVSFYMEELSNNETDESSDSSRNEDDPEVGGPPPLGPGPKTRPQPGPQGPPTSGGGGGPPIPNGPSEPVQRCCVPNPSRQYTGRYREDVSMNECYENVDDTLRKVSKTNVETVFKENLDKSVAMWQYFADSAGHYIQYPDSDRMCDQASPNHTSPLLQEWFVEKLYMERKNLVILVDNGPRTSTAGSGTPYTDRDLLIDAVQQTLRTLTPNDKVNIVTLQTLRGGRRTTEACTDRLFIATPSNLDRLSSFVSQLPYGTGEQGLTEAFEKVYKLYQYEKVESQDHSVQHFVYIVGKPENSSVTGMLAKVADQNNRKLKTTAGTTDLQWPAIPNLVELSPIGKEGVLEIVEQRDKFPITAATYFNRLPPQLDNKKASIIVPVYDKTAGLLMSVATTVFGQDPDLPIGVAAVDASLGEVFSDIVNVDVGQKSYGFIVDITHGHVLIHPKLHDGSDGRHSNMLFPHLQLLEPEFSQDQIQSILGANETVSSFNTSIRLGRLLVTGELVKTESTKREPVTVYYQLGYGTSLCVVFVHFLSDEVDTSLQRVPVQGPLQAPYHRIDELLPSPVVNKPDRDNVCNLHGVFLSYKESVIKLSPWVFNKPIEYKYSPESFDQISELNSFLINESPTNLIREDQKLLIQHFVLSTDGLNSLWKDGDKDVIERFLGSVSGVFRLYPGSPMDNMFDHMQTDWYKRSVAFPGITMYHYGKLSFTNRNKVVIVSKALVEAGRLQGVVGQTITRRLLTSKLMKSVPDCHGKDKQCHIVDATGNILDSLLPDDDLHLSKTYPWLTRKLTQRGSLVVDWCTGYSDGYHKETFTLTTTLTLDLSSQDPCQHYSVQSINGTNLFILILGNRTKLGCDDQKYEICSSCQTVAPVDPYHLSLPQCQLCLSNLTTQCQCQCYCDTDLDLCEGQFKVNTQNFPRDACFYPVYHSSRSELQPSSPGPDSGLEFCPIPCAAIEDVEVCEQLNHCKLDETVVYTTCIWKDEEELQQTNVSRFFPTTALSEPPTLPRLSTNDKMPTHSSKPLPLTSSQKTPITTTHLTTSKATHFSPTTRPSSRITQTPAQLSSKQVSHPSSGSPTFVSHSTGSPVLPVTSGSQLHPITGTSTVSSIVSTVKAPLAQSKPDDNGLGGGAIAAIVLSILLILAVLAFIAAKLYAKKFRRPGADTSTKYRSRSSIFDSTIFNRATNEVTTGVAPQSTVPYDNLQQP